MRDSYIQDIKKLSAAEKSEINKVYKAALLASQQSFFESYQSGAKVRFEILEGSVEYDDQTSQFIFNPSKTFQALLENSANKSTSALFEKKLSRFAALLQEAIRDYND